MSIATSRTRAGFRLGVALSWLLCVPALAQVAGAPEERGAEDHAARARYHWHFEDAAGARSAASADGSQGQPDWDYTDVVVREESRCIGSGLRASARSEFVLLRQATDRVGTLQVRWPVPTVAPASGSPLRWTLSIERCDPQGDCRSATHRGGGEPSAVVWADLRDAGVVGEGATARVTAELHWDRAECPVPELAWHLPYESVAGGRDAVASRSRFEVIQRGPRRGMAVPLAQKISAGADLDHPVDKGKSPQQRFGSWEVCPDADARKGLLPDEWWSRFALAPGVQGAARLAHGPREDVLYIAPTAHGTDVTPCGERDSSWQRWPLGGRAVARPEPFAGGFAVALADGVLAYADPQVEGQWRRWGGVFPPVLDPWECLEGVALASVGEYIAVGAETPSVSVFHPATGQTLLAAVPRPLVPGRVLHGSGTSVWMLTAGGQFVVVSANGTVDIVGQSIGDPVAGPVPVRSERGAGLSWATRAGEVYLYEGTHVVLAGTCDMEIVWGGLARADGGAEWWSRGGGRCVLSWAEAGWSVERDALGIVPWGLPVASLGGDRAMVRSGSSWMSGRRSASVHEFASAHQFDWTASAAGALTAHYTWLAPPAPLYATAATRSALAVELDLGPTLRSSPPVMSAPPPPPAVLAASAPSPRAPTAPNRHLLWLGMACLAGAVLLLLAASWRTRTRYAQHSDGL